MAAFDEVNLQLEALHIDENTIIELNQLSGSAFQDACLERNSNENEDNTGLRVHYGAHVACLFLRHLTKLLHNKRICEIGCGVGLLGLFVLKHLNIHSIVLTDGNESACKLASMNISRYLSTQCKDGLLNDRVSDFKGISEVCVQKLSWSAADITNIKSQHQFDVVIGCELMYYNTDLDALAWTVSQLLLDSRSGNNDNTSNGSNGIFLHAHIFRRSDQEQDLIDVFKKFGLVTFEVPINSFIDPGTLALHSEYFRVRSLLTAESDVITALTITYPELTIVPFSPTYNYEFEIDSEHTEPEIKLSTESLAALFSR